MPILERVVRMFVARYLLLLVELVALDRRGLGSFIHEMSFGVRLLLTLFQASVQFAILRVLMFRVDARCVCDAAPRHCCPQTLSAAHHGATPVPVGIQRRA